MQHPRRCVAPGERQVARRGRASQQRLLARRACTSGPSRLPSAASSIRRSGRTRASTSKRSNSRRSLRIVTIASGGCNVMSYLTADPERIVAVDLNATHVALNKLKLAALRHPPRPCLVLPLVRRRRHRRQRRRLRPVTCAATSTHHSRLLGADGSAGPSAHHALRARLPPLRPARPLHRRRAICSPASTAKTRGACSPPARSRSSDRIFRTELAPLFDKRFVRWLLGIRMSLYGLGIPPAQYVSLSEGASTGRRRQRAASQNSPAISISRDNYFAWQAFNRAYAPAGRGPASPLSAGRQFRCASGMRAHRVRVELDLDDRIPRQPAGRLPSIATSSSTPRTGCPTQDLTRLWQQITRTARPGARVIFRTAARESVLPGRLPESLLVALALRSRQIKRIGAPATAPPSTAASISTCSPRIGAVTDHGRTPGTWMASIAISVSSTISRASITCSDATG